jgi:acetylornithine deacetylase
MRMERYREVKTPVRYPAYPPFSFRSVPKAGKAMHVFELTRALVDIESITDNETAVAAYLHDYLSTLAARSGGRVEQMHVEGARSNVLAYWGQPAVTLSTHMDTVPPFFPSREDAEFIWGRGACDAKGIIAAMIGAAENLLAESISNFALLFVVGEERNSAGAAVAARSPRGSRFLVNGEPTSNKLALASKGALRFELVARGRMAHSAYPELGESAIEALLDALEKIRRVPLPHDPLLGPCTMNIGVISGGRAPNVIADEASAEILIRLVGDPAPVRESFAAALGLPAVAGEPRRSSPIAEAGRVQLNEILCIPAMRFAAVDGLPTIVVPFTTDIPMFARTWGEPLLFGPGDVHVAHTTEECIAKKELLDAVEIYSQMVKRLQSRGAA